jgi:hypothetical protein
LLSLQAVERTDLIISEPFDKAKIEGSITEKAFW